MTVPMIILPTVCVFKKFSFPTVVNDSRGQTHQLADSELKSKERISLHSVV